MTKYLLKSKKLFLLLGLLSISSLVSAQKDQLTLEVSQLYTSFNFTDSAGEKMNKEYAGKYTGAYNLGYLYTAESGFLFKAGMGMRNAGATLVYDDTNYLWDLKYAEAKVGVGYIYELNRFSPYFSASGYFGYLIKANQSLNNENFDILKSKAISNSDYGVLFTPGLNVEINKTISVYTEFNYLMGLKNIEMSDNGQKTFNKAFGLSLGLSINLERPY